MEYTILSQYACGCQIREFKGGVKGYRTKDTVIEYCPKHKAAEDMYEALKESSMWVAKMSADGNLIAGRVLGRINKALRKAESK